MRLLLVLSMLLLLEGSWGEIDTCLNELDNEFPSSVSFIAHRAIVDADPDMPCVTRKRCTGVVENYYEESTWFIEPVKGSSGISYKRNWIQRYTVECPSPALMYFTVQSLDLAPPINNVCEDYVQFNATGYPPTERFCDACPELLLNTSSQALIVDGPVTVDFCSNSDSMVGTGFVIRASCFNPRNWYTSSCVAQLIPDFQDYVNINLTMITRTDRSVGDEEEKDKADDEFGVDEREERMREILKEKTGEDSKSIKKAGRLLSKRQRGQTQPRELYTFGPGAVVTYSNNRVIINRTSSGQSNLVFNDILCLDASNTLVGTRRFTGSTTLSFNGPGTFERRGQFYGLLTFTVELDDFIPCPEIVQITNEIYTFIYNTYVEPYPAVDSYDEEDEGFVFPLLNEDQANNRTITRMIFGTIDPIQTAGYSGVLHATLTPDPNDRPRPTTGPECRRAVQLYFAPFENQAIPSRLFNFCSLYRRSCEPQLRDACLALLRAGRCVIREDEDKKK